MESLAYENATPMDVGPPPLRGDVWILGRRYTLPRGMFRHSLQTTLTSFWRSSVRFREIRRHSVVVYGVVLCSKRACKYHNSNNFVISGIHCV